MLKEPANLEKKIGVIAELFACTLITVIKSTQDGKHYSTCLAKIVAVCLF